MATSRSSRSNSRSNSNSRSRSPYSRSSYPRGTDPPTTTTRGSNSLARSRSRSSGRGGGRSRRYAQTDGPSITSSRSRSHSRSRSRNSSLGNSNSRSSSPSITTPSLLSSRRSHGDSPLPSPRSQPRSPTPPTTRHCHQHDQLQLTRSQSWDGRTKHYDRNKLKSHPHPDETTRKLTRQLSQFDLKLSSNSDDGADPVVTTTGDSRTERRIGRSRKTFSSTIGRSRSRPRRSSKSIRSNLRKIATKKKKTTKKTDDKNNNNGTRSKSPFKKGRMNKNENKKSIAKSFLKDKMMPLMPVITGNSCKKYGQQHKNNNRLGNSQNGIIQGGRRTGMREEGDGSTTYFSEEESSSYCSSSSEASSYYSSEEEEGAYGLDEEKDGDVMYDDGDYSDDKEYVSENDSESSYYEGENEDTYYSSDSEDSVDEEGSFRSESSSVDTSHVDSRSKSHSASSKGRREVQIGELSSNHRREMINRQDRKNRRNTQDKSSQRQLARLSKENDTLRMRVMALRADFETMLRQMNSIEEDNQSRSGFGGGDDSVATDGDYSRVSSCIQRIEEVKSRAMDKLEEEEKRRENGGRRGNTSVMGKDKDVCTYNECIDDLLMENERLLQKVMTLSQEREEILKEVHALRSSSNDKCIGSDSRGSLLTDGIMSQTHNQVMDDIESLIRRIREQGGDFDKDEEAMGKEIMELVSKILLQRSVPPTGMPENDHPRQAIKTSKDGEREENGGRSIIDDGQEAAANQENERNNDSRHRGSEHSNQGSESDRTLLNVSMCDEDEGYVDEDEPPYIVKDGDVSSNSLFDGTSPSTVDSEGRGADEKDDDHGDDSSTLEIVYEYDDNNHPEARRVPSSYSRRGKQSSTTTSSSTHRDYDGESNYDNSNGDDSYSSEQEEECCSPSQGSKSTTSRDVRSFVEDVEYPPRGYHRYSPSSSRHSQHSSRNSSSQGSAAARHNSHCRRHSKPFHSQSSSSAVSDEERAMSTANDQEEFSEARGHDDGSTEFSEELNFGETQNGESTTTLEDRKRDQEDQLVNAIENHLISTVLMKPHGSGGVSTPSTSCASASAASESTASAYTTSSSEDLKASFGSESTKERKGISITVVSRASRHISFPSSPEHTYVTFFRATLSKSQVDAVLGEQFLETREVLEASAMTHQHTNCTSTAFNKQQQKTRKKKYQGEYNKKSERHGYGVYTSKNGNEYRGEWHNDKREGLGVVKIGNGDVFEGQFDSNLKNGIGVYHFVDGECDLSHYKNDVRIGNSVRYSKDREQAFLISGDSGSNAVSLEEAAQVAREMGTIVEY